MTPLIKALREKLVFERGEFSDCPPSVSSMAEQIHNNIPTEALIKCVEALEKSEKFFMDNGDFRGTSIHSSAFMAIAELKRVLGVV